MAKWLTQKQWVKVLPPFVRCKTERLRSPDDLVVVKGWIMRNCEGWVYHYTSNESVFVFEKSEDAVHFRLWINGDPLGASNLEIL